jgi:hypothetical protein
MVYVLSFVLLVGLLRYILGDIFWSILIVSVGFLIYFLGVVAFIWLVALGIVAFMSHRWYEQWNEVQGKTFSATRLIDEDAARVLLRGQYQIPIDPLSSNSGVQWCRDNLKHPVWYRTSDLINGDYELCWRLLDHTYVGFATGHISGLRFASREDQAKYILFWGQGDTNG